MLCENLRGLRSNFAPPKSFQTLCENEEEDALYAPSEHGPEARLSFSNTAQTRGAFPTPSMRRTTRQRASSPQHRYEMRRPPTILGATTSRSENVRWAQHRPSRVTQIVERDPSTRSYMLIRRPCNSSLSSETPTAYSRGITLSTS
ncbi:hypothetical protein CK203_087641 [Vitis vinifera]|uniref:Uncharacterized protein n=1 Tax=Vitis vinifera TaxID=29760 RepID=A0A438C755_VITVI|nr:hypothetical protein CK203_087641 [Vitis vinifera]